MPTPRRLPVVVTGTVGGVFAGLTGVGGGAVMVPLMTGLLGLSQRLAHGTSLAILLFTGIAGFVVYALVEDISWEFIPVIAAGSIVGAAFGARFLQEIPDQLLRLLFALYLLAVGTRMFIG
jgi:uncharacterized protein